MLAALVVVWLGTEPELAERRTDLAAWASAHELRAEVLRPSGPGYDAELVERVEGLLEEARAATAAEPSPGPLERAEALLLEHPELPQAAWLLAERFAIEAHALDAASAARRQELVERARALEGARAEPVGAALPAAANAAPAATAPVSTASTAPVPAGPQPSASQRAGEARSGTAPPPSGARPRDAVFIDGVRLATSPGLGPGAAVPDAAALAAGHHHIRVTRAGQLVWAGWVTLEAGRAWSFPDPSRACSALDLADVVARNGTAEPAPGVLCARWAVARPSLRGGADLAQCAGSRCGPWQHASTAPPPDARSRAPETDAEPGAWPAWATWSLIGAGTLAATGLVLWRAGAFEHDEPGTEFVFTGPSAPALRF